MPTGFKYFNSSFCFYSINKSEFLTIFEFMFLFNKTIKLHKLRLKNHCKLVNRYQTTGHQDMLIAV